MPGAGPRVTPPMTWRAARTRGAPAARDSAAVRSLTIPGHPLQVRVARGFIARTLADHGRCHEGACVLVSELVTNSLTHSDSGLPGGTITVTVTVARDAALIEVTDDGGAAEPVLRDADPFALCGRGLRLVDAISSDWGYYRLGKKLVTWFQVPAADGAPGQEGCAAW
jgi:anti-sigma regulatory factor (Ser/Thr protein kinase)